VVSFCTVLSACSKHVQIAHAVSYIIDIPSAEACGHRSPLYNARRKKACVYTAWKPLQHYLEFLYRQFNDWLKLLAMHDIIGSIYRYK